MSEPTIFTPEEMSEELKRIGQSFIQQKTLVEARIPWGKTRILGDYKEFNQKENDDMKEIKTQKIVDLYQNKRLHNVDLDFNTKEEEILNKDNLYSFISKKLKEVNTEILKNGYDEIEICVGNYTSNETDGELNKLSWERDKAKDDIKVSVFEIKAMLSACDTYEQEMEVLKNYKIIGEDGKLSV